MMIEILRVLALIVAVGSIPAVIIVTVRDRRAAAARVRSKKVDPPGPTPSPPPLKSGTAKGATSPYRRR